MADEAPSTPGTNQMSNTEQHGATAAAAAAPVPPPRVRPLPQTVFDPAAVFMEAYDCAKLNNNWNKVSSSLMIHPEWLTKIPEGRRWTMLHQIVYSGNVMHLNEVLALQANNPNFRLLCKTLDDKTVREVGQERAHIHPQMMRRIERLVAVDQLLNNAKDGRWELCRQFIRQQPDIVNEKPPYRRYYLAHFMASKGELDLFKDFSTMCQFKLDLVADNKTINQVARDNNHIEFAEYIESLEPSLLANSNTNNGETAGATAAPNPPYPTGRPRHHPPLFSQGFYDDPGIMIFSIHPNNQGNLFIAPQDESASYPSHYHDHQPNHDQHIITHSLLQGQHPTTMTTHVTYPDSDEEKVVDKSKASASQMTDEEQAAYEKTVNDNLKKMTEQNLINCITCCITKAILRDPVVAADGFTYEREAILNWFEHSTRSPMTNQELENLELKPNHAIKSILTTLMETNKQPTSKSGSK